jgi:NDP-mannose synthase
MQALILAGGKGTRLRPYTTVLPKPLMPIGDYPILEVILRQFKGAGITEVILAVGYLSQLFQAFFQDGSRYGLKITYSFENETLGTAGPIASVIDQLDDNFILINGDILTTLNYKNLFCYHQKMNAAATIGLYQRDVKIDFGVIESDKDGKLVRYIEKPTYHFDVSMGVNVLNSKIIRPYLTPREYLDLPNLMVRLIEDGYSVFCYREPCFWLDIGRIDDYQQAIEIFEERQDEFFNSQDSA